MKRSTLFMTVLAVFCFFCFSFSVAKASATKPVEKYSTTFKAQKKWLQIPIKNGAAKRNVEILIDGERVRWFNVELADDVPDWFAYLDISEWKGKSLELFVDELPATSKAFSPIVQTKHDNNSGKLYSEAYRGQFHFSPKRGWNNDPNGLTYYKGQYHLFFQHNPYGVDWGNMHWGHAVSKDLVHWKEVGEALYPDKDGTMYSGGGVVDVNNSSNLAEGKEPPMTLFYTGDGTWIQGLAYTQDGKKFNKFERPLVTKITDGNRDPKVIWHEPTKKWVMVFYVTESGDQHAMHFYNSDNLKDWTPTSVVKGGIGNDRYLFECPEFFELEVEGGNGEKKWILTGANSEYAVGTFDGITFTPEVERLNGQLGRDFYAAQTFSNEPKGRRIEIGWFRTHTKDKGMIFNQSMSIPLELKLVKTQDGPRLTRTPVKELEVLRKKHHSFTQKSIKANASNILEGIKSELAEIRIEFEPGNASEITFEVRGLPVVYNTAKEELLIDGVRAHAPLTNGKQSLIIYADRIGLEVFANNGLVFMPINKNLDPAETSFSIKVKDGESKINKVDLYELKSSWL